MGALWLVKKWGSRGLFKCPCLELCSKHNSIFMMPPSQKEWDKGVAVIVAPKDIRKQEDRIQGQWCYRQNCQTRERCRQENMASKKRVKDRVNRAAQVAQSFSREDIGQIPDHLVALTLDTSQQEEVKEEEWLVAPPNTKRQRERREAIEELVARNAPGQDYEEK